MAGSALLVTLGSFALLILAYIFYGRFLAKRIFQLDPNRRTPAHRLRDGVDYVPTKIPVLFGHHFASIAGLGPIVGPALAVIWGWVPAVLWVVFGSIFLGAVHDLGALTVSLRFRGRSIGDVCRELIGPRARLLFLIIIFFAMSLAMGIFVNLISELFLKEYPDAIIPSFGLMAVAMVIGIAVYKFKVPLLPVTVVGLIVFGGLIALGSMQPVTSYDWFLRSETRESLQRARTVTPAGAESPSLTRPYGGKQALEYFEEKGNTKAAAELSSVLGTGSTLGTAQVSWIVLLLGYGFAASVLPVWLLLQPRDYINSFQLYFALAFLLLGLVFATATFAPQADIHAEAFRTVGVDFNKPDPNSQSPNQISALHFMWPFLFVTIACGAVSGFHSLVSSGTTVRQLNRETDALPIGYGAMLTEAALAILVIMACVAGLGSRAFADRYDNFGAGAGGPLSAVIEGGANLLTMVQIPLGFTVLRIPLPFAVTFLSVTIVAFAMTTLDSAVRLLRFNVEEIFRSIKLNALANRYVASAVAVGGIALFGLTPGSRIMWILFGTTNQLLAGLTLLTVSVFLYKLRRPIIYTLVPMLLMLSVTIWAMISSIYQFWLDSASNPMNWVRIPVSAIVLLISLWLMVEAAMSFARGRDDVEFEEAEESEEEKELVTV